MKWHVTVSLALRSATSCAGYSFLYSFHVSHVTLTTVSTDAGSAKAAAKTAAKATKAAAVTAAHEACKARREAARVEKQAACIQKSKHTLAIMLPCSDDQRDSSATNQSPARSSRELHMSTGACTQNNKHPVGKLASPSSMHAGLQQEVQHELHRQADCIGPDGHLSSSWQRKSNRSGRVRTMLQEMHANGTIKTLDVYDSDNSQDKIEAITRMRTIRRVCHFLTLATACIFWLVIWQQRTESFLSCVSNLT